MDAYDTEKARFSVFKVARISELTLSDTFSKRHFTPLPYDGGAWMNENKVPVILHVQKIVLDRFHIIQHLGRAFLKTRIAIMNQFDKKSLPYRALKNYWRLFRKDSRKLSCKSFHSKTFCQTLNPHEVLEKTLDFSEEFANYHNLYHL